MTIDPELTQMERVDFSPFRKSFVFVQKSHFLYYVLYRMVFIPLYFMPFTHISICIRP